VKNSINDINVKKPSDSKLTAIRLAGTIYNENGKSYSTVECLCHCGNKTTVIVDAVIRGGTKSCGCIRKGKPNYKRRSPYPLHLRKVWQAIIDRCYNPNDTGYKIYGGRGVEVCDEWRNDMKSFCEWALKNGWKKGLQIDKDKIGDGLLYSPETCCILTRTENCNNRRDNKKYLFDGEMITIPEISRRTGLKEKRLYWEVYYHKKFISI